MRQLLILCLLAALASCQKPLQQSGNEATPSSEAGPSKGVDRSHKDKPAPEVTFKDAEGEDTSLADFSGKPVLVNLWATWCAPCVKELPTLDRIAGAHRKGEQLNVVAISQDTGPHASVIAFLKAHRIAALEPYQDSNMGLSGALGPDTVLPTTILYDASGKEVWRYVGDLDWTSADAAKLLAEAKPGGKG